jgi:hypothetical protein
MPLGKQSNLPGAEKTINLPGTMKKNLKKFDDARKLKLLSTMNTVNVIWEEASIKSNLYKGTSISSWQSKLKIEGYLAGRKHLKFLGWRDALSYLSEGKH